MSYKQIKTPNLDPVIWQNGKVLNSWMGWCLSYVQVAFGAAWAGPDAWTAWNTSDGRHADGNIPTDVYVPIWFDGWWQGHRYGHTAIIYINSKNGSVKVWSSPYTNKPYADVFGSIPEVERIYGMRYVGWSECVGKTRVIAPVPVKRGISAAELTALFRELLERDPDESAKKYYTGNKTYDETRHDIIHSPERNALLARKERERAAAEKARQEAEAARKRAEEAKARAQAEREAAEATARRKEAEAAALLEKQRRDKEAQAAMQQEQLAEVLKQTKENGGMLKRLLEMLSSLIEKITKIFK